MKIVRMFKTHLGLTSSRVRFVEISASRNTNGQGGGAIMEGTYSVYRCTNGSLSYAVCKP